MNFVLKPEAETDSKMFSLLNKTPEKNLLQFYNQALNEADKNSDIRQKLTAFNKVINFCSKDLGCLNDNSRKRDMVLYWTYNNIGDIFMTEAIKNKDVASYFDAEVNYQRALNFSRNAEEKISVLEKLAALYLQYDDLSNYYEVKDSLIEVMPITARSEAFEKLADEAKDYNRKIYFLEKALNFVNYEKVSAKLRCEQTIRLCEKLRDLYADKKDYANLARIEELRINTSYLIH